MDYYENLPTNCPPTGAIDAELGVLWRLSKNSPPKFEDFDSHALVGKIKPKGLCECNWASCSLVSTELSARSMTKLPNFKSFVPIAVRIGVGSGMSLSNAKHVHFWRYKHFDPMNHLLDNTAA